MERGMGSSNRTIDRTYLLPHVQEQMKGFVTKTPIKADKSGNVPTSINLLLTGDWKPEYHPDFELTADDLREMVTHFEQGVGLVVEDDIKAPINSDTWLVTRPQAG